MHVCDVYDALCSRRPYRDAWSQANALDLLRSLQGTELDPEIYPAFERMVQRATEERTVLGESQLVVQA